MPPPMTRRIRLSVRMRLTLIPRIYDGDIAAFEIAHVACRNGHAARSCDSGNLTVDRADPAALAPARGNDDPIMSSCGLIEGENTVCEDLRIDPLSNKSKGIFPLPSS